MLLVQSIIKDKQSESRIVDLEAGLKQKQETLAGLCPMQARVRSTTPSSHIRFLDKDPFKSTDNSGSRENVS